MPSNKKIQLTIKVDDSSSYLPNWGVREGLREIIQNAKDAEAEFNSLMKIEWFKGSTGREALRITNEGCVITKEALLFGHTTKANNNSLIGQFGEGLKLAFLVFAREGMDIKVFTGDEIWVPTIEQSDVFGTKVLSVEIRPAKFKNLVKIEIEGLKKEDWNTYSQDYLFVSKPKKGSVISVPTGDILQEEKHVGKIYVKGIFVESRDTMWGYNFNKAELDRDRKMVNYWSYEENKAAIIDEAIKTNKIKPETILGFLETDWEDVRGYYFHTKIQDYCVDQIVKSFEKKYGKEAVAVQHDAEAIEIGHLNPNAKPIVVPNTLGKILQRKKGTFEDVKNKLINETLKVYDRDSLSKEEILSLGWGLGSVNLILGKLNYDKISMSGVTICDFRSPSLLGQFCTNNGQIKLSKNVLQNRNLTLEVLIHEVAHRFGKDAEKSHVSMIEKFWSTLVEELTLNVKL